MTPHAKYGVKNLFRPFSKYQGSAPEFGATWVCLSAYTGLRGLYRWTEPGLFLLNHCSNYPKVSVCCLFIKNWIVVKGHSIPRGSQWKNRSDKESWGFTIDTAVNEHLTWSASLWVGPGLTQFWKHVQKVWMCGRCPRPTGPVSSRRSISSSVEHCLGSRRAVCRLF